MKKHIANEYHADALHMQILELIKTQPVSVEIVVGKRTPQQNSAMHVFFGQVADALNDAGEDQIKVYNQMKQGVELQWTQHTVKENLWKPLQQALTGDVSTTDLKTKDPSIIYENLVRFLGTRLGVVCPPFPDRHNRR